MKKVYLLIATALLLFACNEQNTPEEPQTPPTEEPQTEQSENMVAAYFINPVAWNGNFTEISNAMVVINQPKVYAPARAKSALAYPIYDVTPDNGTWPIDVTVNYGDSAIGTDGLEHSGIMRIHATGLFEAEGSVLTPTFENFKCYGSVLSGRQTITNTGKNGAGNLVFDVTVADGQLGEGREYIYSEHTLRELVNGLDENGMLVPEVSEHQYSITGQMKMQSRVDTIPGYEISIDSVPMLISVGDLYPTGGIVEITLDKPIEYDMSKMGNDSPFPGMTISVQTIVLHFTGKTADGNYGAKMVIYIEMGFFTMNFSLQCELNADGVVPESIQYQWGE